MTREEIINILSRPKTMKNTPNDILEAHDMAIRALEQIDKIKEIMAIDNMVIQEDVLKYKMICEVLK